jgi:hypothetical protein
MFDLGGGRAILKRVRPAASLHHANTTLPRPFLFTRLKVLRRKEGLSRTINTLPNPASPRPALVMTWRIDARSGRTSPLRLADWIPTETHGRVYREPLSVPSVVHACRAMSLAETT